MGVQLEAFVAPAGGVLFGRFRWRCLENRRDVVGVSLGGPI